MDQIPLLGGLPVTLKGASEMLSIFPSPTEAPGLQGKGRSGQSVGVLSHATPKQKSDLRGGEGKEILGRRDFIGYQLPDLSEWRKEEKSVWSTYEQKWNWVFLVAQTMSLPTVKKMQEVWVGKRPWRREWLPTSVSLPGEFQGQRILEGYSPWG